LVRVYLVVFNELRSPDLGNYTLRGWKKFKYHTNPQWAISEKLWLKRMDKESDCSKQE
jgi:hypothetical protein